MSGKLNHKGLSKAANEAESAQLAAKLAEEARANRQRAAAELKEKEAARKAAAHAASAGFVGSADSFEFAAETGYMQGRASAQMDRHVLVKDLEKAGKALKFPLDMLDKPIALFSIYDGHIGPKCSEYCAQNFHKKLLPKLSKVSRQRDQTIEQQVSASLRAALAEVDQEFVTKFRTESSGCSAQIGLVIGRRLYVAGLGVAQALLFSQDQDDPIKPWTAEVLHGIHLASNPGEQERVKSTGGSIVDVAPGVQHVGGPDFARQMRDFRMQAATGMGGGQKPPSSSPITRSLGDRELKVPKAVLSCDPEVRIVLLQRQHRALALVCDGILDVMKPEDMCIMMETHVGSENTCASDLVQEAYNRGSEQNVTAVALFFRWPNKRTHDKAFGSGLSVNPDPPKVQKVEPQIEALKAKRRAAQAESSQQRSEKQRKVDDSNQPVGERPQAEHDHCFIEAVTGELEQELNKIKKSCEQELATEVALFRDEDGDIAHEFWEEAVVSGNVLLRRVVSGITRLGKA
eukprot:gnl/MRDRNA2_/MRDRNA2_118371_c0_seq1.p1 gnl/MRDRNA2_/MRDRNA2_118371_c0~~gnl/MRDRNA2_/MRDRNA2_118371_c0_seq1.p1  ORF type:complete len:517 (+),score=122.39 gnl/MRDRNA2_/MRDRNA2_118371_c0_seq1:84-1634(+)